MLKILLQKSLAVCATLAILSMYSMVALAGVDTLSDLSVSGNVKVNGRTAVTGSSVASGSTIVTEENSSAVINLGKLGRVEVLPKTSFTVNFTKNTITGSLSEGKVRVMANDGINASVNTKEGSVVADGTQANSFMVEAECSHTHVAATSGNVSLNGAGENKQVAAGGEASVGNLSQTGCRPCMRPVPGGANAPFPAVGLGAGALLGLLLAAGGAVGTAIALGSGSNGTEVTTNPGTVIVSPVR